MTSFDPAVSGPAARSPKRCRRVSALACAALVVGVMSGISGRVQAAAAEDWPTFGHDNTHTGVSADTSIGATVAPGLTLKWTQSLGGGKILASPTVVYNASLAAPLVYVASESTAGQVDAINADTGAVVWSVALGTGVDSSPAVYGNTVYFGAGNHRVYALDATTGAVQCTSFDTGGGIGASPVVADLDGTGPVVFVGDNGTSERHNGGHEWAIFGVGGLNPACTQKWMFNSWANKGPKGTKTGSWSSPALATATNGQPLLVFGSSNPDNSVYALDASTGLEVWRFHTLQTGGDQDVGAAPTIGLPGANGIGGDGLVYVNGKDKIEYALDMLSGLEKWEFSLVDNAGICTKNGITGPCKTNSVSSTVLVNGMVVVNYYVYTFALNAITGTEQWRSQARLSAGMPTLASPAVSGASGDQVVFTGDLTGVEYGYQLSDGSQIVSYTVPGAPAKILSTAAIAYGKVIFAANTSLLALG